MKTASGLWPLIACLTLAFTAARAPAASGARSTPLAPLPLVSAGWKSSWAPDGQRLVYGLGNGEGLEILDLRTLERTKVCDRGKDPIWSPDGRWIAYVREESHNEIQHEQVWLTQPDGTDAHWLGTGGYPVWASDGKSVYALRRDNWEFVALDAASGETRSLGEFRQSYYPAISPDGKHIAFGAEGSLKVIERESGRVVHSVPAEKDRGLLPAWSPDGKYVGFGGYDADSTGLRVLEMATGRHAMIWPGPFTMPAWTADGARMAFDERSFGNRSILQVGRRWIEGRLSGEVSLPEPPPDAIPALVLEPEPEPEPEPPSDTTALLGKPAPGFRLTTLDDQSIDLATLKGRPVVIDFWATWCPPCRRALPHLNEIANHAVYREKGLQVLAIDLREDRDQVAKFMKDNKYQFTVPLDTDGAVGDRYQVQGIPTTVVIDRQGNLQDVFVGFGPTSAQRLDEAIERALR